MVNLPLDEPAIRHYLRETQCAIPVFALPYIVWLAVDPSRRLQEQLRRAQEQNLQNMQPRYQMQQMIQLPFRVDGRRGRAWDKALLDKKGRGAAPLIRRPLPL